MHSFVLTRLLAAGCVVGLVGCSDAPLEAAIGRPGGPEDPRMPTSTTLAALARASSCEDLLGKIQDDAIAKVKMATELARRLGADGNAAGGFDEHDSAEEAGFPTVATAASGGTRNAGAAPPPALSSDSAGPAPEAAPTPSGAQVPTSASDTNRQVEDVDEADFVKVVQKGAFMYVLHGNTLRRLKTFPPEQTALSGAAAVLEGAPSEMFVTDQGKAVVFSTVYDSHFEPRPGQPSIDLPCPPDRACGGGQSALKITQLDVTTHPPPVERERYYDGSYVSSRRYTGEASDIVRVVVQSASGHQSLYAPEIDWTDAWGRRYAADVIDRQLAAWEARTVGVVRATTLDDWLPGARERVNGALVTLAPPCASYYVPTAGLAEYGLTQVLSIDVAQPAAPATGVTIVGATSTIYSNIERMVLAQPDYRWRSNARDFGTLDEQRTALHVFDLLGNNTTYVASGWVPGHLPPHNPQFGIDVAIDGTLRVATTGNVRDDPGATPGSEAFWRQHPETRVITARAEGNQLRELGRTGDLGLPNERVQSARFVGNRAYVVTFLQTDPLVVVDVSNPAAPAVLGQIKIPGFSQYMHPLDENHLITVGQSAARGIQLQLFDVTTPGRIPPPFVHDFGSGSASEASYSHKAFTFHAGILAVPVSGAYTSGDLRRRYYTSALQLLRVDASTGFRHLGAVDHAPLYADNGAGVRCGVCDTTGCHAYACGYSPEVRRGHFVTTESKTYVYSFSHAGVLVNDLGNLSVPLARLGLPALTQGLGSSGVKTDAGRSIGTSAISVDSAALP